MNDFSQKGDVQFFAVYKNAGKTYFSGIIIGFRFFFFKLVKKLMTYPLFVKDCVDVALAAVYKLTTCLNLINKSQITGGI